MEILSQNFGVKFDFEIKADTRSFDQVDAAAVKAGITESLPDKPSKGTAITRAMAYLTRTCVSSIEFPSWSAFSQWKDKRSNERRNPNFSLKITNVKRASTDAGSAWRINVADNRVNGENLGHVLNVAYDPTNGVYFTKGTDMNAFLVFGREMQEVVTSEFARFLSNYNDEDLRHVLDTELTQMKALKIIKKTNCFIPRDYVDRALRLYTFTKECGQVVSWLGLDNSNMTRDSLLADLKTAIFTDMDEYEEKLDAALNATGGERKRGEKLRERMFNTANANIDRIMATAEYHAIVLGVMAEGIRERRDVLKAKAAEFLVKDFNAPAQQTQLSAVKNTDEVF